MRGHWKPSPASDLPAMRDMTQILSAIEQGDAQATDQLLSMNYQELRRRTFSVLDRPSCSLVQRMSK